MKDDRFEMDVYAVRDVFNALNRKDYNDKAIEALEKKLGQWLWAEEGETPFGEDR